MRRTDRLDFDRALDRALLAHQQLAGAQRIER
jgi:hypothetical protein